MSKQELFSAKAGNELCVPLSYIHMTNYFILTDEHASVFVSLL